MKKEITHEFANAVLKLGSDYEIKYSTRFINIEVKNIETQEVRFINIHEFIHTHCRDYLLGFSNGLKTKAETKSSDIDKRILILYFDVYIVVPNLVNGANVEHAETFSGLSELKVYVDAVEWLMKYRKDNPKLSKFWINKF